LIKAGKHHTGTLKVSIFSNMVLLSQFSYMDCLSA
jgi:hypothetical protein